MLSARQHMEISLMDDRDWRDQIGWPTPSSKEHLKINEYPSDVAKRLEWLKINQIVFGSKSHLVWSIVTDGNLYHSISKSCIRCVHVFDIDKSPHIPTSIIPLMIRPLSSLFVAHVGWSTWAPNLLPSSSKTKTLFVLYCTMHNRQNTLQLRYSMSLVRSICLFNR